MGQHNAMHFRALAKFGIAPGHLKDAYIATHRQFMREYVGPGNSVQRVILQTRTNPKSLALNGSSIWVGQCGGWVRIH